MKATRFLLMVAFLIGSKAFGNNLPMGQFSEDCSDQKNSFSIAIFPPKESPRIRVSAQKFTSNIENLTPQPCDSGTCYSTKVTLDIEFAFGNDIWNAYRDCFGDSVEIKLTEIQALDDETIYLKDRSPYSITTPGCSTVWKTYERVLNKCH